MKRDDRVYLRHILDAITQIESYLDNATHEKFQTTPLLQDGAIRQLEIIGEATKNLSVALRDQYPQIPWRKMAGLRDILIHQYFGLDIGAIWLTTQRDLPIVKPLVVDILQDLDESETG